MKKDDGEAVARLDDRHLRSLESLLGDGHSIVISSAELTGMIADIRDYRAQHRADVEAIEMTIRGIAADVLSTDGQITESMAQAVSTIATRTADQVDRTTRQIVQRVTSAGQIKEALVCVAGEVVCEYLAPRAQVAVWPIVMETIRRATEKVAAAAVQLTWEDVVELAWARALVVDDDDAPLSERTMRTCAVLDRLIATHGSPPDANVAEARIAAALTRLGAEHEPRPDWQETVMAERDAQAMSLSLEEAKLARIAAALTRLGAEHEHIAALFVATGGCYFGLPNVDPWDLARDARKYTGPYPVVAHPPCERFGRWAGEQIGQDDGCFAAALAAVQRWGGVIEHPEASAAWRIYGINLPPRNGGWIEAGNGNDFTCCVEQGHYGHRARKATWLYACGTDLPSLKWGPSEAMIKPRPGRDPVRERRIGAVQRMSRKQRRATPPPFRDLLLSIAATARTSESYGPADALTKEVNL